MKKLICLLLALVITLPAAFALDVEEHNLDTLSEIKTQDTEYTSGESVERTNLPGLAVRSAYRVSPGFIRVTFENNTNSVIAAALAEIVDAPILFNLISHFRSFSVPANSTRTYDIYIGGHFRAWLRLDRSYRPLLQIWPPR